MIGTASDDVVAGDAEGNSFFGEDGSDILNGAGGADTLAGGLGDDAMDGGAGRDLASYESAVNGVVVDLANGVATGQGIDSLERIEEVVGSAFADTLTGSGTGNLLIGGDGDDSLMGAAGSDTLVGLAGNDTLGTGIGGAESLDGGTGRDTADFTWRGESVAVLLTDDIEANSGTALVSIENVIGSAFDDILFGDADANWLDGGAGDDVIDGGAGDDTLRGGVGNDVLDGNTGRDLVSFAGDPGPVVADLGEGSASGTGTETLISIESALGTDFDDSIIGSDVGNWLGGGAGNDTLLGGLGNDTLNVGIDGADSLDGGDGRDTADFSGRPAAVTVLLADSIEADSGTVLVDVENVIGTSFDDVILGDAEANYLDGGAGDDVIGGEDENDTLVGGLGDDVLDGGDGQDMASYAAAAGPVVVDLADESASGEGTDALTSIESARGSAFDDSITGSSVANWLGGGLGNDTLSGLEGNDSLLGGAAGADALDGGSGRDTADFSERGAEVTVLLADGIEASSGTTLVNIENVVGTSFDDVIVGDAQANWLNGAAGDDVVSGEAGNDTVLGGTGDDVLDGGEGRDLVDFSSGAGPVVVDLGAESASGAGTDALTSFESALGTSLDDALTGNALGNWLGGGAGNDTLVGGLGDDSLAVGAGGAESLDGGEGRDLADFSARDAAVTVLLADGIEADSGTVLVGIENVVGTAEDDVIVGDAERNWLNGGAGDDVVSGEGGNDTLIGGTGDDILDGGEGRDLADFSGDAGPVVVDLGAESASGAGDDVLISIESALGTGLADALTGSDAANWLGGGAGNDTLVGGLGDDSLALGLGGAESLDGGEGRDLADFSGRDAPVTVLLADGIEAESGTVLVAIENVVGTAGDDVIIGDAQANRLDGGAGDDVVEGAEGDDTLIGGLGDDVLQGGTGVDFVSYQTVLAALVVNLGEESATGEGSDALFEIESALGGFGNDTLIGDDVNNWLGGGFGDDSLSGGLGSDTLSAGEDGADTLVGGAGLDRASFATRLEGITLLMEDGIEASSGTILSEIEEAVGSEFDDLMVGDAGSNQLIGLAGDDVLEGGLGNDTLNGGAGDNVLGGGLGLDVVSYDGAGVAAVVNLGDGNGTGTADGSDVLTDIEGAVGSSFNDTLTGDTFANWFQGGIGNDSATGGEGNDTLVAGRGADTLDGGDGIDSLGFSSALGGVVVVLPGGIEETTGTVLISIENVTGTIYDDEIIGDANGNALSGGLGDDILTGGAGDDSLIGGAGTNGLDGGTEFDVVNYQFSSVSVVASLADGIGTGPGIDALVRMEGIIGSAFADTLIGASVGDGLNGFDNRLVGGAGDDSIEGRGGNDTVMGGSGDNTLDGGDGGGDQLDYGSAAGPMAIDFYLGTATGSGINDTLVLTTTFVVLPGDVAATQVDISTFENATGSAFADTIGGDQSWNYIYGNGGDDSLLGYGGNDNIYGGFGADTMWGDSDYTAAGSTVPRDQDGQGADLFVFAIGETDGDMVMDFRGDAATDLLIDQLRFEGYGPGATFTFTAAVVVDGVDSSIWTVATFDNSVQEELTLVGVTSAAQLGFGENFSFG